MKRNGISRGKTHFCKALGPETAECKSPIFAGCLALFKV